MERTNISISNKMSKPVKCIYYAIVLFGNVVVNKVPSRHIRKWFYQMLGAKLGKRINGTINVFKIFIKYKLK